MGEMGGKAGSGGLYIDRKSTRLNSSHSQISYAVFCLKKKKKLDVRTTERTDIVGVLSAQTDFDCDMHYGYGRLRRGIVDAHDCGDAEDISMRHEFLRL